jgi:hypothetical protein
MAQLFGHRLQHVRGDESRDTALTVMPFRDLFRQCLGKPDDASLEAE